MLKELDAIFQTLEEHSGITMAVAHREYMEKLILERTVSMELSAAEYNELIRRDDGELSYLTNAAAVNETYFFREEKQFDFLKDDIFLPRKGSHLNIWSASCSTGEEPISIYTLARHCGVSASISASDIDTDALDKFKAGVYTKNSFRSDGSQYRELIEQTGSWSGERMTVSQDVISQIRIFPYNLASTSAPPVQDGSMDIIFMRNVFIYFTQELRLRILNKMAKSLKDGGIIILSVNEVGNIDRKGIPFEKLHSGTIYYLKKASAEEPKDDTASPAVTRRPEQGEPHKPAAPRPVVPIQAKPPLPPKAAPAATRPAPVIKPAAKPAAADVGIRELFAAIKDCIGKHDCAAARKCLAEKVFKPHEMEFKYFFSALISMEEKDDRQTLEQMEKAVLLNGSFWPARYGMAMLYRKAGNEAASRKCFEECRKSIATYRQDKRDDYDFLTGQFSPEYFEMLCTNYLKGTGEGRE